MKLTLPKEKLQEQPTTLLRRAGYSYIHDRRTGQSSFVRRLGQNFYPRFHCRVFDQGGLVTFTLHLDQRPTRYSGAPAHAAEKDTPAVQQEMERLQEVINKQEVLEKKDSSKPKKKSGWWPFRK